MTPASGTIDTGQTLNVTAAVTGAGRTPTGTVTLSGGGYTSSAQTPGWRQAHICHSCKQPERGNRYLDCFLWRGRQYSTQHRIRHRYCDASSLCACGDLPRGYQSRAVRDLDDHRRRRAPPISGTMTLPALLTTSPARCCRTRRLDLRRRHDLPWRPDTCERKRFDLVATTAATAAHEATCVGGWAEAESERFSPCSCSSEFRPGVAAWRAMLGAFVLLATLGSLAACGRWRFEQQRRGGKRSWNDCGKLCLYRDGRPEAIPPRPNKPLHFTVVVN